MPKSFRLAGGCIRQASYLFCLFLLFTVHKKVLHEAMMSLKHPVLTGTRSAACAEGNMCVVGD